MRGYFLKYFRKRKRLSRPELAKILACTSDYIYLVETGRRSISVEQAFRLATAAGADKNEIANKIRQTLDNELQEKII